MRVISNNGGFSIVEVVCALALGTMALAAAASASFGAQALLTRSVMYTQTLLDTRHSLNMLHASSSYFYTITSFVASTSHNTTHTVSVTDITPCIKHAHVFSHWFFPKPEGFISSDTFISYPHYAEQTQESCISMEQDPGVWSRHSIETIDTFFPHSSDIDVLDEFIVVSYNATSSDEIDIRIFQKEYPMRLISEYDSGAGIVAIDATQDTIFAVTHSTSTQLVVIDISHPENPYISDTSSLVDVDPFGSFPQGRSIFFFDDVVYVGTRETAGPEFHMFDVSNTSSVVEIASYELTHNIHDITVRDAIVYLATSADAQELIILDVSDVSNVHEISFLNLGTQVQNDRDATTLYLIGNALYIGRKRGLSGNPELYAVDVSNVLFPTTLWSFDISLSHNTSYVSGVFAIGNMLFVSTTDESMPAFMLHTKDIPYIVGEIDTPSVVALDIDAQTLYLFDQNGGINVINADM